jgi:hypothetical protein
VPHATCHPHCTRSCTLRKDYCEYPSVLQRPPRCRQPLRPWWSTVWYSLCRTLPLCSRPRIACIGAMGSDGAVRRESQHAACANRFAFRSGRQVIDLKYSFHFDLEEFLSPPEFDWDYEALAARRPERTPFPHRCHPRAPLCTRTQPSPLTAHARSLGSPKPVQGRAMLLGQGAARQVEAYNARRGEGAQCTRARCELRALPHAGFADCSAFLGEVSLLSSNPTSRTRAHAPPRYPRHAPPVRVRPGQTDAHTPRRAAQQVGVCPSRRRKTLTLLQGRNSMTGAATGGSTYLPTYLPAYLPTCRWVGGWGLRTVLSRALTGGVVCC